MNIRPSLTYAHPILVKSEVIFALNLCVRLSAICCIHMRLSDILRLPYTWPPLTLPETFSSKQCSSSFSYL